MNNINSIFSMSIRRIGISVCTSIIILLLFFPTILSAHYKRGKIFFDGVERTYSVFLPQNYDSTSNFPVVFHLHGDTHNSSTAIRYTQLSTVADTAGFLAVYPNGLDATWNFGEGGTVNDVGFINAIIDTLKMNYKIDLSRVYLTGWSSGSLMSYKLVSQIGERIAAIATVAGGIITGVSDSCYSHPIPILYMHGTADNLISYRNGEPDYGIISAEESVNFWINCNQCTNPDTISIPDYNPSDGSTVNKITYKNDENNSSVVFYRIRNGGHRWPGDGEYPTPAGNTNKDISAGVESWNFLKKYNIPSLSNVTSKAKLPIDIFLFQNYPNPFNSTTKIDYKITNSTYVKISIYNMVGEELETLVSDYKERGLYSTNWNASQYSSGVFICQITTDSYSKSRKMVLLR